MQLRHTISEATTSSPLDGNTKASNFLASSHSMEMYNLFNMSNQRLDSMITSALVTLA